MNKLMKRCTFLLGLDRRMNRYVILIIWIRVRSASLFWLDGKTNKVQHFSDLMDESKKHCTFLIGWIEALHFLIGWISGLNTSLFLLDG